MKTRLLAAVFVVCCLLLCGLILRRQIAAHPLPPESAQRFENDGDGRGQGRFWMEMEGGQIASPAVGALARQTVAGQIAALGNGDGPKVWEYQSRDLRQRFSSPAILMQLITRHYPELVHPRRVTYKPVFTDKSGRMAHALILLEGEDGNRVWEDYFLVREGGQFKVGGVQHIPGPDRGR
jgi:hypothetical protein